MASQFAHKQPTRFNEPEIPSDLATKGYVDNRQLAVQWMINFSTTEPIQAHNGQWMWTGQNTALTTRASRSTFLPESCSVTHLNCNVDNNGNTDVNSLVLAVDGVDSALQVDIAASTTGLFTADNAGIAFSADENASLHVEIGADTVNTCRVRGIALSGIFT